MEVTLVLLLQIASGFCINLQSLESYLENNAELQRNDKSEQRSLKQLNDNPEHVNPGRRIFKVLPVKPNKKWTTKYQDQPDKRPPTEEIPIAIIVAAKHNLDDAKMNTEFVYPLQKSEEVIDIKRSKTDHLKDNISPSSPLNTTKSGTESSNYVEPRNPIQVPETIVSRKSMQHANKDLKEESLEAEESKFNDTINKYLNNTDDTMMIPKLDITDKKEEDSTGDEHYDDDKLTQIQDDGNIEREEKKPTVLKIKDPIHKIETRFFKPTKDYKNELNDVIKNDLDDSKNLVGQKPHKGFIYKDFNLFFIFNK